jgi:hypothetical protein
MSAYDDYDQPRRYHSTRTRYRERDEPRTSRASSLRLLPVTTADPANTTTTLPLLVAHAASQAAETETTTTTATGTLTTPLLPPPALLLAMVLDVAGTAHVGEMTATMTQSTRGPLLAARSMTARSLALKMCWVDSVSAR